jgi:hypothetical protein
MEPRPGACRLVPVWNWFAKACGIQKEIKEVIKWSKEGPALIDVLKRIVEKAEPLHIMALREEP